VTVQESGTRISHRETRLRKRIDDLTDQRDKALAELWDTRDRNDELEARVDRLHSTNTELRRSRDKWKEKAKAAEWGNRKERMDVDRYESLQDAARLDRLRTTHQRGCACV
jgi:uncharacterized protein (DUF3084 family)